MSAHDESSLFSLALLRRGLSAQVANSSSAPPLLDPIPQVTFSVNENGELVFVDHSAVENAEAAMASRRLAVAPHIVEPMKDLSARPSSWSGVLTSKKARLAQWLAVENAAKPARDAQLEALKVEKGWPERLPSPSGSDAVLVGEYDGSLLFCIPFNLNAADTVSTDEVWPGGTTGYDLDGAAAINFHATGAPPALAVDPVDLMLRNDLDLRVIGPIGQVHLPWVLNPANPAAAATSGDNTRDNVEQVLITASAAGHSMVKVSHKGMRVDDAQAVSIIDSGNDPTPAPDMRDIALEQTATSEFTLSWPSVVGANYQLQTSIDLINWVDEGGELSALSTTVAVSMPVPADGTYYRISRLR